MPAESAFTLAGSLAPGPNTELLTSYRGKIIAIIGSRNNWGQATEVRQEEEVMNLLCNYLFWMM